MDDLEVRGHTILDAELEESFDTSGGPGGQHANRNATAVRLRLDVAGSSLPDDVKRTLTDRIGDVIEVHAAESRSQFRNRALARQRMAEVIEEALKPRPRRKKTRPTRASQVRRVEEKRKRGETKRLRQPPSPPE